MLKTDKHIPRFLLPIYLIFFLFYVNLLSGQDTSKIKFDRISSEIINYEKGLSQNSGFCILQDHQGYIWIGTWDGLNRYDGYTFKVYGKKEGLSNTTINTIMEDDDHKLWIGTENGLNILDPATNEISVEYHDPEESNSLSDNFINHICQDSEGVIWICTSKGLNKYYKNDDVYTRHYFYFPEDVDSIRSNWINKAYEDQDGNMWIGSRHGLFMYDSFSGIFIPYFHSPEDSRSLSSDVVQEIFQDNEGTIWIGTGYGLNKFNLHTEEFTSYLYDETDQLSLSNNNVTSIYQDSHGLFWIGTQNILNLFDRENEVFEHIKHTDEQTSLSNENIYTIYEDNANSIWIGTYKGINILNRNSSKFRHYNKSFSQENTLSNNIIFAFHLDPDNKLWIGTAEGLNILDRNTDQYRLFRHQIDELHNLSEVKIRSILKDSRGKYWFGTEVYGLFLYDKQSENITRFVHDDDDPGSIASNDVFCLLECSDSSIWIGTRNGLSIFDPETGKFRSHIHDPKDLNSISHNLIWCIYEDRDENLWVGTDRGLNKYIEEMDMFIRYLNDPQDPHSLGSDKVFSVFEDTNGMYWIGTMGGGLNRFDPRRNTFTSFTEEDGLPNNVVYTTLKDKQGNLWLSTNWGLSKFNPKDTSFINYDVKDGLQGNEFNGNAWLKSDDGELFFGGMNGFNAFYPSEIKYNHRVPKIVITAFKKFNKVVNRPIRDGDTIYLDYDDNFFSFEFSALDYTNPSKNKYKFRMEGFDLDWIYRDADRRIAEYANVSPGTYTFHVTGSNNDGVWNQEGLSLNIVIIPPWWGTWAFRIPFGLFLVVTIWFIIYRRIQNIKAKHEVERKVLAIERQLFDIEQKALQLQMNPHFIFNSLNAIQSFVIANDTDKAIHYLAKFSQLMRLILTNSRESHVPVKDELKALTIFMDIEKLRFDNKFDYSIKLDPKIDEEFMAIPPMILQPFVENAILHGVIHSPKHGIIDIRLKLQKDTIFCTIEDNGIGREEAIRIKEASGIKRESKGMLITKERIELLNKQNKDKYSVDIIDLKDNTGKARGTRVEIKMFYEEI